MGNIVQTNQAKIGDYRIFEHQFLPIPRLAYQQTIMSTKLPVNRSYGVYFIYPEERVKAEVKEERKWYLLYVIRYFGMIVMTIYVHMCSCELKYITLSLSLSLFLSRPIRGEAED